MARERGLRYALLGLAAWAVWLVREHPFFWDTIQLGSKHAHWYYEQGFRYLLLPDHIDSGHPPGFGLYLAAAWALFGKSLVVSHFAMLPFVLGIVVLLFPVGRYFSSNWAWAFPLLALANPVLAAQLVLISPDVVLVFGFLLVLYGVLYDRIAAKVLGALLMAAISTRGMMCVLVLYAFELGRLGWPNWKILVNKAWAYVPAGLLALAFLTYHYIEKGWIGYHANSPWAPHFEGAGWMATLRNAMVLAWRFLDYGLVFVWLALAIASYSVWRKAAPLKANPIRESALLFVLSTLLLSLPFLRYQGLHAHRYLLPAMLGLQLFAFALISNSGLSGKLRQGLLALMFVGLLTGHCWIYPASVAQGWDSTLAHLPYYSLKREMIDRLDARGIPLGEVGTAFPEIGPQYLKDLSDRMDGFSPKDLETQAYILWSNIMNDFTDAELDALQAEWRTDTRLCRGSICLVLYTNR